MSDPCLSQGTIVAQSHNQRSQRIHRVVYKELDQDEDEGTGSKVDRLQLQDSGPFKATPLAQHSA